MSDLFTDKWESIPANDLLREFLREAPGDVEGVFNASASYYRMDLLRKLMGLFDMKGQPESWDMDYFWSVLFMEGYVGVSDTALGVIPLRCAYTGINVYNHPTELLFTNNVLGDFRKVIDRDAVLVHLMYDYLSAAPILRKYATLLAMCDSALAVNLMNSKVTFIGLASNKSQANSMKRMYDRITAGEPAVFVNQDVGNPANFYFNRVKENYIGEALLSTKRSIMNEFLTSIGINNANTDKRERLNSEEVNANNEEIGINVTDWLNNLRTGIKKVNDMFGLNITVKLKDWADPERREEGTDEPAESDRLPTGDL